MHAVDLRQRFRGALVAVRYVGCQGRSLELTGGVAAMLAVQLLFTCTPCRNKLLHSACCSSLAWLKMLSVGLIVFVAVELNKSLDARRGIGGARDPDARRTLT